MSQSRTVTNEVVQNIAECGGSGWPEVDWNHGDHESAVGSDTVMRSVPIIIAIGNAQFSFEKTV